MAFKLFITPRIVIGSLLLILFLTGFWQYFSYQHFLTQPINVTDGQILSIKKGQGVASLATELSLSGAIKQPLYLRVLGKFEPRLTQLKVGEYRLSKGETPVSLLEKLSSGKVIQYSFTIVEGMNIYQTLEKLAVAPYLKNDWPTDESKLAQALGIDTEKVEGWLYPDTYFYARDTSGLALLRRAKESMADLVDTEWEKRETGLPYRSAYEALIMASIIEKETAIASERDKIARVFISRLEKKMRLQTDPTVIYGIGPDFNGDITSRDLKKPTAYNTYVIKGLPPSPIAMPGKESVLAALHPAEGNWLYFVADGKGGHKFSESLEQHNQAVKDYLAQQRK